MKLHEETKTEIAKDMSMLKHNIIAHQEPDSLRILEHKINREREYLQN